MTLIFKEEIDPVVSHFYDAVLLYGNMVAFLSSQGLDYTSGINFTNAVANYSFPSPVTGTVTFNADSDRLSSYDMLFFNPDNGKHEVRPEFTFPGILTSRDLFFFLIRLKQKPKQSR